MDEVEEPIGTRSNGAERDEDEDGGEEAEKEGRKGASKAEKEKKRMRGKNKTLKRYLRKQRKNVIDPRAVRLSFVPF